VVKDGVVVVKGAAVVAAAKDGFVHSIPGPAAS
jgi:hypothetical protein